MAAESSSLSTSLDRHLFLRVLLEAILYGEPDFEEDRRSKLKIPGICVTDAGSLYDHLNKTGSIPEERQILIDLLTARDLSEMKIVEIKKTATQDHLYLKLVNHKWLTTLIKMTTEYLKTTIEQNFLVEQVTLT